MGKSKKKRTQVACSPRQLLEKESTKILESTALVFWLENGRGQRHCPFDPHRLVPPSDLHKPRRHQLTVMQSRTSRDKALTSRTPESHIAPAPLPFPPAQDGGNPVVPKLPCAVLPQTNVPAPLCHLCEGGGLRGAGLTLAPQWRLRYLTCNLIVSPITWFFAYRVAHHATDVQSTEPVRGRASLAVERGYIS